MAIGHEERPTVDLVTRDRVLALARNQPIDEGVAQCRLHMRAFGGIHEYRVILVEQATLIALNDDLKFTAVLKRHPSAAIGKHISLGSGGSVERSPHALSDLLVPRASVLRDVDVGLLPEIEFADMRARAIAARDE